MKLFKRMKDGGPESRVVGFWLIEAKKLFSIVVLRFDDGSREAFHSHAFNSVSWVLRGELRENRIVDTDQPSPRFQVVTSFRPGLKPVITTRSNMHKVESVGTTWVISFRGPWANTWKEFLPETKEFVTLTHGRQVVRS